MPEYVYAVHEFNPENPDEVAFRVGERIEVIEKDDLYGDGWWQGRNPSGKVGLFPQSYTSPKPPASSTISFPESAQSPSSEDENSSSDIHTSSTLQPLHELSESTTPHDTHTPSNGIATRSNDADREVMRETLTDVQKAIEQLGRSDDGTRSFSFASSHGGDTDRSETETETDRESEAEDELGWHKGARQKLALRAQQENEERAAREREEASGSGTLSIPSTPLRSSVPPIEVELSDESDDDGDDEEEGRRRRNSEAGYLRRHPHIPEEDEDQDEPADLGKGPVVATSSLERDNTLKPGRDHSMLATPRSQTSELSDSIVPSEHYIVPSLPHDDSSLLTATAATFSPLISASPEDASSLHRSEASPPSSPPMQPSIEESIAVVEPLGPAIVMSTSTPVPPPVMSPSASTIRAVEPLSFGTASTLSSPTESSVGSVIPSSLGIQQTLTPASTGSWHGDNTNSTTSDGAKKVVANPLEWSVEEVVDWLKSKGFDQSTCDKFVEQEITGDVLLELDAQVLKSEIGIAAFGKRTRIVNAIAELRRPPSLSRSSSEHHPSVLTPASLTHSFMQTHTPSHSHTPSMQSSAPQSYNGSPLAYAALAFSPSAPMPMMPGSAGLSSLMSAESGPHTGDFLGTPPKNGMWRVSDPGSVSMSALDERDRRPLAGLGLGVPSSPAANGDGKTKMRPAQLVLSPSDSALRVTAVGDDFVPDAEGSERAAMSEGEATKTVEHKSKRKRLFGNGSLKEKASSIQETSSRHSREATTPVSASHSDPKRDSTDQKPAAKPIPRSNSKKKSPDDRKASDRLSLFGGSFTGTLGKNRKPPPRISTAIERGDSEKHSHSTFSRIRHPIDKHSRRPSTSDGSVRKEGILSPKSVKDFGEKPKDASVLRKRTASGSEMPHRDVVAAAPALGGGLTLRPGKSILEQIGTPDHNGWMRKKGDRYNTWKLRYFVLKGPHLYCLRSDDRREVKIKGYVNIVGYKVIADESVDPGRYGFKIVHDTDKTHQFSSEEQIVIREWMKALMKATITRDYSNPVMSSCNIPTIPLTVAQAMNPAPRPPSPTARDATQKALRRENPNQLSSRDAQVLLMGMPGKDVGTNGHSARERLESFFTNDTVSMNGPEPAPKKHPLAKLTAPPRPSRELRRLASSSQSDLAIAVDPALIEWANSHLPGSLQITDPTGSLRGGLALLRLAEDIRGKPASPPVPDSAFPTSPNDDKLDGLFRLFDFLLDNDVKMGTVTINDVRLGKREKIVQLLRALKAWEDKRKAIVHSIGKGSMGAGLFTAT